MVTNLNVDTALLQEAIALDEEATIETLQVLDLLGTIDYDEN